VLSVVLVALLLASGCAATGGSGTIVIGTKEFTEQWIMGQLYQEALQDEGFHVEVKNNIGSTKIIDRALTADRIDLYPEYTGVILQILANRKKLPHTARATYVQAKRFEETRGLTLLPPTPFQNTYAAAVRTSFAKQHHLKTIGDLRRLGPITYADYPSNIHASTGCYGVKKAYHLPDMKCVPLNIGLQYKALASEAVQVADVFTTDPQLARQPLTLLKDTKTIFGYQNVSPVMKQSTLHKLPKRAIDTINRIDAMLTPKAIRALNRAVAVDRISPAQVAMKFLKANKVLT
jgi:osmoprotectant transport system substrate-binding protein